MKCALCQNEKELKKSHIIPEFFYKSLYEKVGNSYRFNVVPLDSDQKLRYKQKGLTEPLLCEDCEGQLSQYENHVRQIFYGGTGIYITNGNPIKIEGIDYQKFKLFQLSILWRASVSNLDFFENVSLGPHEEKIRKMIFNETPGSNLKYPCLFFMMLMEQNDVLDSFIYPPQMLRIDGHRVFRFIFGGGFWIFFVSSHTNMIRHTQFFLKESGEIQIPLRRAEETRFFRELAQNIAKKSRI